MGCGRVDYRYECSRACRGQDANYYRSAMVNDDQCARAGCSATRRDRGRYSSRFSIYGASSSISRIVNGSYRNSKAKGSSYGATNCYCKSGPSSSYFRHVGAFNGASSIFFIGGACSGEGGSYVTNDLLRNRVISKRPSCRRSREWWRVSFASRGLGCQGFFLQGSKGSWFLYFRVCEGGSSYGMRRYQRGHPSGGIKMQCARGVYRGRYNDSRSQERSLSAYKEDDFCYSNGFQFMTYILRRQSYGEANYCYIACEKAKCRSARYEASGHCLYQSAYVFSYGTIDRLGGRIKSSYSLRGHARGGGCRGVFETCVCEYKRGALFYMRGVPRRRFRSSPGYQVNGPCDRYVSRRGAYRGRSQRTRTSSNGLSRYDGASGASRGLVENGSNALVSSLVYEGDGVRGDAYTYSRGGGVTGQRMIFSSVSFFHQVNGGSSGGSRPRGEDRSSFLRRNYGWNGVSAPREGNGRRTTCDRLVFTNPRAGVKFTIMFLRCYVCVYYTRILEADLPFQKYIYFFCLVFFRPSCSPFMSAMVPYSMWWHTTPL